MESSASEFVPLTRSSNPVQQSLIKEILTEAGIPFISSEQLGPMAFFGGASPVDYVEFQVDAGRLQEAKDLLCSNGVVCDVSERLLNRTLHEVVVPLLGVEDRDLERLIYLVGINNKETLTALYEATRKLEGGHRLLEDLFFEMARQGQAGLLVLARVLAGDATAAFGDRFFNVATEGEKGTRLALLDVASALPKRFWLLDSVAAALRDPDAEIRDAGSEALFAVEGKDYGYEPDGPEEDREAAVERFLEAVRLR